MATDTRYFTDSGLYTPNPRSIYAEYNGECPNPCRKYHISSAIEGAERVSAVVLPYLASKKIFHKVVKCRSLLVRQTYKDEETFGDQAGKFITIYMPANVSQRNQVIEVLGAKLSELANQLLAEPCPKVPRSRSYSHVFAEQPLDEGFFIYGGFICDPTE